MCGRFTLTLDQEALSVALGVEHLLVPHHPRWNITPTQVVPVLRLEDGVRIVEGMRWGLVPFWAEDPSIGNRLINARAETVASRPAFRDAFRRGRHAIIPADGFYEWAGPAGARVPHWIRRRDRRLLGMAGLWEEWGPRNGGDLLRSVTILTVDAGEDVRPLHERMPAILPPEEWDGWLSGMRRAEDVAEGLLPSPSGTLEAFPVSTLVNRPGNEGPELLEGVEDRVSG